MTLVRMQVSVREGVATPERDAVVNTLYFNVSGSLDQPGYQGLVNDVYALWSVQPWGLGRYHDVRAYDMGDAKPRPIKAEKQALAAGTKSTGPPQIALALSYYADRNLPRARGRIFIGPWNISASGGGVRPTVDQQNAVLAFGQGLAGIGGLNVDWSLYSPTTGDHTRLSNIWVDNAWDVIRSRRLTGTSRVEATING